MGATLPAQIPPYQHRSTGQSRRKSSSSRERQRHSAMWLALFLAVLTIAGTGWFFRDQLAVVWKTYTLKADHESAAEETDHHVTTAAVPVTKVPVPPKSSPVPGAFDPTVRVPPAKGGPQSDPSPPQTAPAPPSVPAPAPAPPSQPQVTIMPAQPTTTKPAPNGGLVEVPGTSLPLPGTSSPGTPLPGPPVNMPVIEAPPEAQPASDSLMKFFAAATWEARLPFVQSPDSMRPLMQQYYTTSPDGPLHVTHIQLIRHDKKPETGPPHCVFQVSGGGLKQPVPIMVESTEDGWRVDWLTFTEFKDDLLVKFLESFQPQPARFHVLIRRAHYFDDDVPALDKKTCFQITPPMPGMSGDVFVLKGTPLAKELDRHLGWDITQAAVVVQLQWRKEDRYQWVELTELVQYNWRNGEAPPPKAVPVDAEADGAKK